MAAHLSAAALRSPAWCFLCVCLIVLVKADYVYNRQELIDIGLKHYWIVTSDFHHAHNIPPAIVRTPGSPWIIGDPRKRRRRRRERKQKRGCRSGILARLRKQPYKPPLPNILLTNTRPLITLFGTMCDSYHWILATLINPRCSSTAIRSYATSPWQKQRLR